MKKQIPFLAFMFAFAIAIWIAPPSFAQKKTEGLQCRDNDNYGRNYRHCEIKEQTLVASGAITVDGRQNGGVSIKGWDRNEVLLRARIETNAPTQAEADQLAGQIRIETTALNIHAEGPEGRDNYGWHVSYEIFVPRQTDLSLTAHNGGISIKEVTGKIQFKTLNGGVNLVNVGGSVQGTTTNGGVNVVLNGMRWEGEVLNVKTTNGGVNIIMPDNYSAHFETGTVNGNVSSDFTLNVPLNEKGRLPKEISVDIGSGGPTIRATTTNGGVRVTRLGSAM
jgi:DUF4097 and DUF4098 domain-containing protein YvlB